MKISLRRQGANLEDFILGNIKSRPIHLSLIPQRRPQLPSLQLRGDGILMGFSSKRIPLLGIHLSIDNVPDGSPTGSRTFPRTSFSAIGKTSWHRRLERLSKKLINCRVLRCCTTKEVRLSAWMLCENPGCAGVWPNAADLHAFASALRPAIQTWDAPFTMLFSRSNCLRPASARSTFYISCRCRKGRGRSGRFSAGRGERADLPYGHRQRSKFQPLFGRLPLRGD